MNNLNKIPRIIESIVKLLIINIPLQLIGAVLLVGYIPIHVKLIQYKWRKSIMLPYLLRWFDNADQYIGRDISTYLTVFSSGWWNIYCWLAWRNPLNYFGYVIAGFQSHEFIESIDIANTTNTNAGYYQLESQGYYEYCWIIKYSPTKCGRYRFGWKLNNTKPGDWVQEVCAIQPWIDFNGI